MFSVAPLTNERDCIIPPTYLLPDAVEGVPVQASIFPTLLDIPTKYFVATPIFKSNYDGS